MGNRINH